MAGGDRRHVRGGGLPGPRSQGDARYAGKAGAQHRYAPPRRGASAGTEGQLQLPVAGQAAAPPGNTVPVTSGAWVASVPGAAVGQAPGPAPSCSTWPLPCTRRSGPRDAQDRPACMSLSSGRQAGHAVPVTSSGVGNKRKSRPVAGIFPLRFARGQRLALRIASGSGALLPVWVSIQTTTTLPSEYSTLASFSSTMRWAMVTEELPRRWT